MKRYRCGIPHWIQVRWTSRCAACSAPIKAGEQAWYWPASKEMYCNRPACGQQAAAEFEDARQDEEFMAAQFAGGRP